MFGGMLMPAPTTDAYTVPIGSGDEPLWEIPGNWSDGLPGSDSLAVIPDGQTALVDSGDDVTVAAVDLSGALFFFAAACCRTSR